jgi:F-type H+-transporting ATPase subunit epsilon
MNEFDLNLVSPEAIVFQGKATYLNVHSQEGYMGIMANHAPLIAGLVPGKVSFKAAGKDKVFTCPTNGFLLISSNTATVFGDSFKETI